MFEDAEIIHTYTRAEAIEDGDLIDVSQTAREAGITVPLALTRAAWADCVEWGAEAQERTGTALQDEAGRLWDVVWMTRYALLRNSAATTTGVELLRVPPTGDELEPRRAELRVHIGPGDQGEPVLTVTLPHED